LHTFLAASSTGRDGLPTSEISLFNGWTNFEVSKLLLRYLPFWQGERLIKRYYDHMILQIVVYQLVNSLVRPDFDIAFGEQIVLKDSPGYKHIMILLSASPRVLRLIIEMVRKSLSVSCVQAFQKNLLEFSIVTGSAHPINALSDSIAHERGIPITSLHMIYFQNNLSILSAVLKGVIAEKFITQDRIRCMEMHCRHINWRASVLRTLDETLTVRNRGDISSDIEELCDLIFELARQGGTDALPLKFLAVRAGLRLVQKLIDCDQQTIIRLIGNGSNMHDLIRTLPAHESIELFKGFLRKLGSANITIDRTPKTELAIRDVVWGAHFDSLNSPGIFSYLSGCLCIAISRKHWKLADLLFEHRIVPWACCVGGAINAGNTELVRKLLCANPQRSEIALKTYKVSPNMDIVREFKSLRRYNDMKMNGFLYTTPYAEAVRLMPQEANNLFDDLESLVFTDDANVLCCLIAAIEGKDEILFRNCLNHLHVSGRQSAASSKVSYSGIHITPEDIHKALFTALHRAVYCRNATIVTELLKFGVPVTEGHLTIALQSGDGGIVRDVLEYFDIPRCFEGHYRNELGERTVTEAARWDEPTALDILFCYPYFRGFKKQALYETIRTGNKRMMDAVFGYGVNLRELEESGLLNEIITTGDIETLREWLDRGIDPCAPQMLATAIQAKDHEIFQMILFAITKRYPQGNGNYGNKELELAIELKDVTSFQMILTHLSTTSKNWFESADALEKAIRANGQESVQMMRTLLKYGADPDAICGGFRNEPPMTPLLHAIMQRSVEKISLLLENADINRPARMGVRRTPLQLAAELGDKTIVDLLLNRGADPNMNAAKLNGATALQLASIKGFVGVVEMLLERNADLFAPAAIHGGRMPFEGAAEHGRLDMMTFLVGKGVLDVEGGAQQVQRAMDLAEKNGNVEAKNHAEALWKMRQQYLQTTRYEDGQANNFLEHYPMWNPQLDAVD
jgi:hypothetical protein